MSATTETTETYTSRDEAICLHSDLYKDLHGFRPRRDWTGISTEEIWAQVNRLSTALSEELDRERREEEEHRAWVAEVTSGAPLVHRPFAVLLAR